MKKILCASLLLIAIILLLAACSQNNETPVHTHSFSEWETTKMPTCKENGEKVRYCDCGEKQTESVLALSHTVVVDEATSPTCTELGKTAGEHCSVCNEVILAQQEIPMLQHTYSGDIDATCEVCGFVRNVECDHTSTTILPAKNATCTSTGLTEGKHCSTCNKVLVQQSVVPALPHTYGEWVVTKTANCGQDGEMARYCSCGAKQTEVVEGEGIHGEIIDPAVEPTCAATGLTEGKHCPYCNTVFVKQEVVPTLEHTYNTTYSFDNSFHWYACSACGAKKDSAEHQIAENNACSICEHPIGPSVGIIYDKSTDGTYAEVIGYEGTATKIRIADTYEGLPVKTIYSNAFYDNDTITSVIIPDSVTSIGSCAFQGCNRLTSVVIPDSVTSIGSCAFNVCSLTSIIIPDSVTSIGRAAFLSCHKLTSVVIGNSVTTIGEEAFSSCSSLTSVIIGDSVTSIGSCAFSNCPRLQFNEYENCKYLGSKDNPYVALIEVATQNMSSYTIHEDTKVIADNAFYNCSRLTSIAIPDSVTSIGSYAFYSCDSLTSVIIGNSVTSIGSSAFYSCDSLTDVYYTGSEEEWAAITIGSSNYDLTHATKHYNYVPEE